MSCRICVTVQSPCLSRDNPNDITMTSPAILSELTKLLQNPQKHYTTIIKDWDKKKKISITLTGRDRGMQKRGERGKHKQSHKQPKFSLPNFIFTPSSFILFKQIIDSKTSAEMSQTSLSLLHSHSPSLSSSFSFNLIKKRAAGRGGRADAHLISGPSVCSAGWLPALYPTRLHGK